MKNDDERDAFCQRLKQVLTAAGVQTDSATELARSFNRRYAGMPITSQSARKWLMGEAIPSQDKLRVLAEWLGCSSEWLRFGAPTGTMREGPKTDPNRDVDYNLMRAVASLSPAHQKVVSELVRALAKAEKSAENSEESA